MRKVVYDVYQCELCGTIYTTADEAQACEQAGVPPLRFPRGSSVRLQPELAPGPLRDETFEVEQAVVILQAPAQLELAEELGLPRHRVSYMLRNHIGRIGLIDEEQLAPLPQ